MGSVDFFYQLHRVLAISGSLERVCSTFGYVWSKMRDKVGENTAKKTGQIVLFQYRPKPRLKQVGFTVIKNYASQTMYKRCKYIDI